MLKMYIMRGLPGSGKSFLAKTLGGVVFSTDDFFMVDGVYQFDWSKLVTYHNLNFQRTEEAVQKREPIIVIDNTNSQRWEAEKYIVLGLDYGYDVQLIEPDTEWKFNPEECHARNTHGVPLESIQKMLARWETFSVDDYR